jgi:hypothetical protein
VLAKQLLPKLNISVRHYLRGLIPDKPAKQSRYFKYCTNALEKYLILRGHSDVDDTCNHLFHVPIIQQADHSNLLLDKETFLNNFMFYLACREAKVNKMITLQCSNVSCLSQRRPVVGPTFLRTRRNLYNVFSFSKTKLKDSNFCSLPRPVQMSFEVIEGSSVDQHDNFLSQFIDKKFVSAPEAYRICNNVIWSSLDSHATVSMVMIDDDMTSELAILHIADTTSPIYRLLFEAPVRDCFIKIKRQFVNSISNLAINSDVPDFFWYRNGSKLVSTKLIGFDKDAYFVLEHTTERLPIPYSPLGITQALRAGVIYVDRIVAYLMRCMLPGIVALGGTSQQDYLNHYKQMILAAHQEHPFLDASDIEEISREDLSRFGGNPLIELDLEQQAIVANLSPSTDLARFAATFLDCTVGDTIGSFSCAEYLIK